MLTFLRTSSVNPDFATLVKQLDAYLAITDGSEHAFYAQYNKLDKIKHVVLVCDDGVPVACGAIKEFSPEAMEVKRMFTAPGHRGKGIARKILIELQNWAKELGYSKCILETGKRQTEAIALYSKCGYQVIDNYGQYAGVENSMCFEKLL